VFPKPLASFFTDDPEVLRLSVSALRLAGIFQLFDDLQVTFTGVLRGLGNTKDSAVANLLGHWGVGLPTALFLIEPWGIVGIWSGLALGLAMVSLGLWIRWVQALGRLKI
jgi:MATE family multidrug resistance protein